MSSVHLHGFHFPKGPNLRLVSVSAVWMFATCLAFFGFFTYMGGSEFSESMGGTAGLAFLAIGFIISAVVAYFERDAA